MSSAIRWVMSDVDARIFVYVLKLGVADEYASLASRYIQDYCETDSAIST